MQECQLGIISRKSERLIGLRRRSRDKSSKGVRCSEMLILLDKIEDSWFYIAVHVWDVQKSELTIATKGTKGQIQILPLW